MMMGSVRLGGSLAMLVRETHALQDLKDEKEWLFGQPDLNWPEILMLVLQALISDHLGC